LAKRLIAEVMAALSEGLADVGHTQANRWSLSAV
jgi:hypothetical protein